MEEQEFGTRLRELRKKLGVTVYELSARTTFDRSYISTIERGVRGTPSFKTIDVLAKGLRVPTTDLLALKNDQTQNYERGNRMHNYKGISPSTAQLSRTLFGEYLMQCRIAADKSLNQVSKRLGISTSTITCYEKGEREPTLQSLIALERFFDIKLYELTDRGGYHDIREPQHMDVKIVPVMEIKEVSEPIKLVTSTTTNDSAPNKICTELLEEVVKARQKHPKPFNSAHEGYAILREEVEELWEDIKRDDFASARKELVQVGAMVIRFLLDVELKTTDTPIWMKAPGQIETFTPPKKKWGLF